MDVYLAHTRMAPRSQWTAEQLEFLQGYLPEFLKCTLEKRQSTFWALLVEAWFDRWPELDKLISSGDLPPEVAEREGEKPYLWPEEHTKLYQEAIQSTKAVSNIEFWYHWVELIHILETSELDEKPSKEGRGNARYNQDIKLTTRLKFAHFATNKTAAMPSGGRGLPPAL